MYKVLPTYHPAFILRQYSNHFIAVQDLRRAKKIVEEGIPEVIEEFIIRPSFEQVMETMRRLLNAARSLPDRQLKLAIDLETRRGHITCVGIGWSDSHAICIPFLEIKNPPDYNYWTTLEEELAIVLLMRKLLTHPNVKILGQNFPYDQQYFARPLRVPS